MLTCKNRQRTGTGKCFALRKPNRLMRPKSTWQIEARHLGSIYVINRSHGSKYLSTPVPQMKTGNVLKHETMANLFMGKEYPVLI